MSFDKIQTRIELPRESINPEEDLRRTKMAEARSAVSDEDIEIITKMLLPDQEKLAKLNSQMQHQRHLQVMAGLNYIRNATGEHYIIDFVLNPKIMNALTIIAINETEREDKLSAVLDIFINTTARSQPLSQALIEKYEMIGFLDNLMSKETKLKNKIVWLLSNLAGKCPELVHCQLKNKNGNYIHNFVDVFTSGKHDDVAPYYGQIVVSLSTIEENRNIIAENYIEKFLPLCGKLNTNRQLKVTTLSLLRNLAIDTRLHKILLSKPVFITAIIEPIMSKEFEFTDEEMDKLPPSLQYYDDMPIVDDDAEACIIDSLYKLCDSRQGREIIRNFYPILREFHKIQKKLQADIELGAGSSAVNIVGPNGPIMQMLDQDNSLEALLGILIRTEEDIGLPSDVNLGDIEMTD